MVFGVISIVVLVSLAVAWRLLEGAWRLLGGCLEVAWIVGRTRCIMVQIASKLLGFEFSMQIIENSLKVY